MIDLKYLQLVQAIHQYGSMTKAAEQLHLTQPALSHQLRELEEKLAVNVFERKGRRLELTPVGGRLLETAGRVLDEIDRAARDVENLASGKTGTLRFTTECYTCYHWIPAVLNQYHKSFPDVDVQIVAEGAKNPKAYLEENNIDAAIVTNTDGFNGGYDMTPLVEDEYICVVHQNHPWAKRTYVEAENFTTEHLISVKDFFDEGNHLYNKLFLSKGITPKKMTAIPVATEAIIEMVKANMGVSIMASWAAASYLDRYPSLTHCKLTRKGIYRPWYVVWPQHKSVFYIREFVRCLKAAFE